MVQATDPVLTDSQEVEVLRASLDDLHDLTRLEAVLSEDEHARARAYRIDEPRRVFILARGLLRIELSKRLAVDPREIAFDLRPSGKPDLRRSDLTRPDWRFSVSHTGSHVAIAFALGDDVGIDIERLDRVVKPLEIARRYFSPGELKELESLPEAQRLRAFLAGWTRKEAVVKSRGDTMAESLTSVSVSLDPEELHPTYRDALDRPACQLTTFEFPALNLMGAVALRSEAVPRLRIGVDNGAAFD